MEHRTRVAVTGKKITPKKPMPKGKTVGAASAAAILGRPQSKGVKTGAPLAASLAWTPVSKVKPDLQKYYQNLLDLHERLRNQMTGLAKESQAEMENYSLHMGDSGTDNFDRDFALSLLSSDQDAIYEIEEALKRIEKNTYGVCELTNKPIPRARLDAIPWTRFTVESQAQLEKEGALRSRNRLGSLGSVETGSGVEVDDDDIEIEEKPAKEKE
jgi:RNA polymerase-binding transcription factor DksA